MNNKCRWAVLRARKDFQNTLENLSTFEQLKEFVKTFVDCLEMVECVKINSQKLQNSINSLKDADLKYLNAVSAKKEVNDSTIFQDIKCNQSF
jgi:hypothetical protein